MHQPYEHHNLDEDSNKNEKKHIKFTCLNCTRENANKKKTAADREKKKYIQTFKLVVFLNFVCSFSFLLLFFFFSVGRCKRRLIPSGSKTIKHIFLTRDILCVCAHAYELMSFYFTVQCISIPLRWIFFSSSCYSLFYS